jgi:hypothetical protein
VAVIGSFVAILAESTAELGDHGHYRVAPFAAELLRKGGKTFAQAANGMKSA